MVVVCWVTRCCLVCDVVWVAVGLVCLIVCVLWVLVVLLHSVWVFVCCVTCFCIAGVMGWRT